MDELLVVMYLCTSKREAEMSRDRDKERAIDIDGQNTDRQTPRLRRGKNPSAEMGGGERGCEGGIARIGFGVFGIGDARPL